MLKTVQLLTLENRLANWPVVRLVNIELEEVSLLLVALDFLNRADEQSYLRTTRLLSPALFKLRVAPPYLNGRRT